MKKIFLPLLGACLVGFCLPTAFAEVTTNSVASLITEAVRDNPEIQYYQAEITAAQAGRKSAAMLAQPELNAELGYKHSTDNTGLRGDGVAWSVSVMQTFEWPGRMGLRKAIANYDITLAELGLHQFRSALANRVRLNAWNLWAARQKLDTARTVQQRFSDLRDVLIQRDPAGIAPALELRVIEATELMLRKRVTDAEVLMQSYRTELNLLRGKPAATEIAIEQAAVTLQPLPSLAGLLAQARTNNFELLLKQAELVQQGFKVDLARNERYPAVSFGPVMSEERSLGRDRIIGVGLTMPLPLWRRNAANVAAATARRTQAEALLNVTLRDIEQRLTRSSQSYETRYAELQKWAKNSIGEFEKAAAQADRHYQLGAVPVTTYVELQKQYVDAVDSLLDLRAEAMQSASELERVTGVELNLVTLQIPTSSNRN
jgi:outer membrane protein, heavy metal efflux system